MADEAGSAGDPQITFKVKTSSDGMHTITIAETATVLALKNLLAGDEYEKIPADRQRLIYSGRVMKDGEQLSTYKIKAGNTIHMVKSAQSNASQQPAAGTTSSPATGVPTNMAAGTANNPLAGLTGARYAGHMALPGRDMFGADGGMGAPPSEEDVASMLDNPATQQLMNEALNNPAMIEQMIQSMPQLRNNPQARQMLNDPGFRRMMTDPNLIRQAASLHRSMQGGGGASAFPAPGATNTTPSGAAASSDANNPTANAAGANPFAMPPGLFGGAGGANPFAGLFNPPTGQTPSQTPPAPGSAGQNTPGAGGDAAAANPFARLFGDMPGGAAGTPPFGMPNLTPEQIQAAMQALQGGAFSNMFGGAGGPASPPAPADNRPPEERWANELRQLNDMGFFDFDRNVAALRRSGGSVQGAIEQLLS